MSSAWWLGKSCMLGFGARSQTPANLLRERECVLNLPSVEQVAAVDRLARSFCQFFGLGPVVHSSRLAEIPESAYRPKPRPAAAVEEAVPGASAR